MPDGGGGGAHLRARTRRRGIRRTLRNGRRNGRRLTRSRGYERRHRRVKVDVRGQRRGVLARHALVQRGSAKLGQLRGRRVVGADPSAHQPLEAQQRRVRREHAHRVLLQRGGPVGGRADRHARGVVVVVVGGVEHARGSKRCGRGGVKRPREARPRPRRISRVGKRAGEPLHRKPPPGVEEVNRGGAMGAGAREVHLDGPVPVAHDSQPHQPVLLRQQARRGGVKRLRLVRRFRLRILLRNFIRIRIRGRDVRVRVLPVRLGRQTRRRV